MNIFEEFNNILEKNLEILSHYNEFTQTLILLFKVNKFQKKKEQLTKELEITERYKQFSDITAITDLLQKLDKSMGSNRKKLKYLEEDFVKRKNQKDQFTKTIIGYTSRIQELTKLKKDSFSLINKITREMSGNSINQKEKSERKVEIDDNLSNAQKIKLFQKKAKDAQIEIKELSLKLSEINLKYEEFNPLYQTYKHDYQKLNDLIKNDANKIEELKSKVKEKIKEKEKDSYPDYEKIDLKSFRSIQEIEEEINNTSSELKSISIPNNLINSQNPRDLSRIIEKLNQINDTASVIENEVKLRKNESEFEKIFESFQKLEIIINDLEDIINIFSSKINLQSHFQVLLSDNNKIFNIQLSFTRNNKNQITFGELTTPEKIFFIIIYFISIEIQLKNNNIIFSNLFIPSNFNKAGSIFRTIKKILPLFAREDFLGFNLIFLLSNLEMKKEIKNLNVITIQES